MMVGGAPLVAQEHIAAPSLGQGIAGALFLLVLAVVAAALVSRSELVSRFLYKRDLSRREAAESLLLLFGSFVVSQTIGRVFLSLAMYGTIFREGYWVVLWALLAAAGYALVLVVRPK